MNIMNGLALFVYFFTHYHRIVYVHVEGSGGRKLAETNGQRDALLVPSTFSQMWFSNEKDKQPELRQKKESLHPNID